MLRNCIARLRALLALAPLALGIALLWWQLHQLLRVRMLLQVRGSLPSLPRLPFLLSLLRPGLHLLLQLCPAAVLALPCCRLLPSTRTCNGWSCGNCNI